MSGEPKRAPPDPMQLLVRIEELESFVRDLQVRMQIIEADVFNRENKGRWWRLWR